MKYNLKNVSRIMKNLYGDTAMVSFPVPSKDEDMMTEKVFLYAATFTSGKTRPFATAVFSMEKGTLLELVDCSYKDFVDTKMYPFSEKLRCAYSDSTLTAKTIKESIDRIYSIYDSIRMISFKNNVSNAERNLIKEYYEIFNKVVPSDLLPFYQALNKSFFEWVEKVSQE